MLHSVYELFRPSMGSGDEISCDVSTSTYKKKHTHTHITSVDPFGAPGLFDRLIAKI